MTTRVELIYDTGCANVQRARRVLLEGFSLAGLTPSWMERDRKSHESPAHVRGYGSPTILVDGRDVAGVAPEQGTHDKGGSDMATNRLVEVFSAGCPACEETVHLVNRVACPSCEVSVLDLNDAAVAKRAKSLGVRSVPAVVIDGKLVDCCAGRGPQEATLRAAGIGQPI